MSNEKAMIIGSAAVGLGVCVAITYACHVTNSAKPLWALLLLPTVKMATTLSTEATE